MSARQTRREFEEIVRRLVDEDPAFGSVTPRLPLVLVAVGGVLLWAALSILMVIWGGPGVLLACVAVAVAAGVGIALTRP
ncbi:hypothetical protein [Actinoplanes sp. NPDC051851]|uniref:hypothetical protein n=1 Tax=Actinoplanes sp. NPDC051851 TaxID=3154753 RepID=UPI00342ECB00